MLNRFRKLLGWEAALKATKIKGYKGVEFVMLSLVVLWSPWIIAANTLVMLINEITVLVERAPSTWGVERLTTITGFVAMSVAVVVATLLMGYSIHVANKTKTPTHLLIHIVYGGSIIFEGMLMYLRLTKYAPDYTTRPTFERFVEEWLPVVYALLIIGLNYVLLMFPEYVESIEKKLDSMKRNKALESQKSSEDEKNNGQPAPSGLTPDRILETLRKLFRAKKLTFTNGEFATIAGVADATATRWLKQLVADGVVQRDIYQQRFFTLNADNAYVKQVQGEIK